MARNAPLDVIDFGQICPLENYPVGISFNQVELVRLDKGEFWIETKSHEIWKKSFFTNSLISYNNKKKWFTFFFFFSKFSHGRLPSWHQLPPGRSALPGQRAWWGNFGQRQNGMKYIRTLFLRSLKYRTTKKNWSKIFRIT